MKLAEIIADLAVKSVSGPLDTEIDGICYDSRKAGPGRLFCALPGEKVDGNDFVDSVIENGAAAILSQKPYPADCPVPWVLVSDARAAMAAAAATFFGHPSHDFPVVGVTGTNGKSTTAFLTHYLMAASWFRAGLVGTFQYQVGENILPAPHTTPESADLQSLFADMREAGCRGAAMEVSSHGLVLKRVAGVRFAAGIFTNLTQDHLDFHKTMDAYFAAKRLLFEQISAQGESGKNAPALIVNRDDRYGERLTKESFPGTRMFTFGQNATCDFKASNIRIDFNGTQFTLAMQGRQVLVKTPLIGRFNVYNTLAALAAAHSVGLNFREAVKHLETAPQVPGRLESVSDRQINYRVYVDYAHTPDALENAIKTLRELKPRRLITVFGCGGDRDRTKRPIMGGVADRLSDFSIITSDNPRTEDPEEIILQARAGMSGNRVEVIENRRDAIARAIELAGERDIVLIAGKGHEDYQEINGVKHPFDDRKVARQVIAAKSEGTYGETIR
ncbi:MAG: UDP-N-acetylmuramoyl-L-alanyl-D-glutamate--2,6-diaminopimelate ligase [Verrucomicrobiae bacterium]|nr:UDP-N-acetylmuramoyl-L-alanyl-D-glutamate--2,6-diaminopimelate ligase [Verrucomicrobiae bacterium]